VPIFHILLSRFALGFTFCLFFTGGEPLPGPAGLLLRQQPDFIQNPTGRYLNVSRAKIVLYCRRCLYSSVIRVDRVSGFLSSRANWLPESLTREFCPPPLVPRGDILARGRGGGGSQFGRRDRHSGIIPLRLPQ
jgi:hypothetical protein